ncbi:hypothetical protein [Clostridium estertheticum]|uniref:hypothetical protein n=1 Tax=Clostridium estertheticum TaxID=238834 RepID=UPI001CF454EF|nr:hypothetical protein [Clostridium estertheticum]MCB2339569.1 hypothetical protein [Clostridium estertheticum]
MIKLNNFTRVVTVTITLVVIIVLFVGCRKKIETVKTIPAKEITRDTTVKNQPNIEVDGNDKIKPVDSKKSEIKKIEMNGNMKKQLDTFFSNFSEAYVEPFENGNISDEKLIRFGIFHVIINNEKLIENKGEVNYGYIKAENIDNKCLYYFGKKPQKHITIKGYLYENGYYKFPRASGEQYTFSQIDKLFDLGNNTYKAEVSIYNASSGFTGDSHGTMDQWKLDEQDIPILSKKINAVIHKSNNNSKTTYILKQYVDDKK